MPINPNTPFRFDSYLVLDDGIQMNFTALNPGAGQRTDYVILLTDAELAGVTPGPTLTALVTSKLQRKIRANGVATKLDPLIGQQIVV